MPKTRAVAYLRVSTEKQADTGVSLDVQRAKAAHGAPNPPEAKFAAP
jgi:hypothetical protein